MMETRHEGQEQISCLDISEIFLFQAYLDLARCVHCIAVLEALLMSHLARNPHDPHPWPPGLAESHLNPTLWFDVTY